MVHQFIFYNTKYANHNSTKNLKVKLQDRLRDPKKNTFAEESLLKQKK